ncbi:hypothetical protein Ciccas_010821, partial [Cichlidogyrus casuarinus]
SDKYSIVTLICQFLVPVMVMSVCYSLIGIFMRRRARNKIGSGSANKVREENEVRRSQKMNKMLISMVIVYVICWIPVNLFNIIRFGTIIKFTPVQDVIIHFVTHCVAMSSSIHNPILYAFLNENFKQEFKKLLFCFGTSSKHASTRIRNVACAKTQNNGTFASPPTHINVKPLEESKPLYKQEADDDDLDSLYRLKSDKL